MSNFKKFRLAIATALLAAFGPTLAQAAATCPLGGGVFVICFDDLTDGPPTVLTNIPGASIGAGLESATVSFTGVAVPGPFPQSYALSETGGDFNPPFSDVANVFGPGMVVFQSDIFASVVPATLPPTVTLVEDGTFQEFDILTAPGVTALEIFIRSDVAGPESIPEPSALQLLSGMLLISALVRWERRRRSNVERAKYPSASRADAISD